MKTKEQFAEWNKAITQRQKENQARVEELNKKYAARFENTKNEMITHFTSKEEGQDDLLSVEASAGNIISAKAKSLDEIDRQYAIDLGVLRDETDKNMEEGFLFDKEWKGFLEIFPGSNIY